MAADIVHFSKVQILPTAKSRLASSMLQFDDTERSSNEAEEVVNGISGMENRSGWPVANTACLFNAILGCGMFCGRSFQSASWIISMVLACS